MERIAILYFRRRDAGPVLRHEDNDFSTNLEVIAIGSEQW